MLKIPLENIIEKIKQEKGISEEEINQKIEAKLKQLSGLISKEGAAHIIANELGVKVFEQTSGKLEIKNILSGMRSVETVGKVTRKFELREFQTENRSGKVSNMVIGDETGSIRIVMWGEQAESINNVNEGDIVKIVGGYVRENQGKPEVHLNDRSKLIINPEGETVNNVVTTEAKPKSERKQIINLNEKMENVELLGTIVQVFEPKFFEVDPVSGKRLRPNEENKYINTKGEEVQPDYSYVMNAVLDDGTETIRCTFFRNQAERLINKTKEEMLEYKDNPASFESIKTELLGNIVKLIGRVNKNDMFDRLEFLAQLVFTNPNPEEELSSTSENKTETTSDPVQQQQEEIITEVEKIN